MSQDLCYLCQTPLLPGGKCQGPSCINVDRAWLAQQMRGVQPDAIRIMAKHQAMRRAFKGIR